MALFSGSNNRKQVAAQRLLYNDQPKIHISYSFFRELQKLCSAAKVLQFVDMVKLAKELYLRSNHQGAFYLCQKQIQYVPFRYCQIVDFKKFSIEKYFGKTAQCGESGNLLSQSQSVPWKSITKCDHVKKIS